MRFDAEAATSASDEEYLVVSDGWGVYYAIPLDVAERHKVSPEQQVWIEDQLAQDELSGYMLAQRGPPAAPEPDMVDLPSIHSLVPLHQSVLTGTLLYLSVRSISNETGEPKQKENQNVKRNDQRTADPFSH